MLTAEAVRARRQGGELKLQRFDRASRERALRLARAYLEAARALLGRTRGELEEALDQVPHEHRDRRLAAGLRKLVEDRCEVESDPGGDPRELRREVFTRAAARRRELLAGAWLDRLEVLGEVARERGLEVAELERLLHADLPERQLLRGLRETSPEALVESYPAAEAQAVLLRASRVTARVRTSSAGAYRELFRALKFRRLLHTIRPEDGGGYRIDIDGPMSVFSSVTKYGLQLALVLPHIQACGRWSIDSEVLWGRGRSRLLFRLEGEARQAEAGEEPRLPDEVASLLERFGALGTDWSVRPAAEVLDLPGAGLCVPDLRFDHAATGTRVYLEVLGFWSRAAVWRRVELVQAGLPERIIFAVPKRLRVSAEVLEGDLPGQLYVYAGTLSPTAIASRLAALLPAGPGRAGK